MADPTEPVASVPADRRPADDSIEFQLNGVDVSAPSTGSLLDALRETLAVRSVKDGCSPQGQCGCCTVLIDGQPRVSCVTPVSRVRGRQVTTIEGLAGAADWADSFVQHGASQCGFCTPGIIMRCAALPERSVAATEKALLAHLCRCTGWQPIVEAVVNVAIDRPDRDSTGESVADDAGEADSDRIDRAEQRARLEGGVPQRVGREVALGGGGFADDTAPLDALVAVRGVDGEWVVGATLAEARALSGKVQGRRTTAPTTWPVEVPPGEWYRTLQTTWVEPASLEPDASWCEPGREPMAANGNGGDFGAKATSEVAGVAQRLADEHQHAVRVLSTREDVVRYGAKRPPLAIGLRDDGSGIVHVARTDGIVEAIGRPHSSDVTNAINDIDVVEVDVVGPATSALIRGAGWAEVEIAIASLQPGPTYSAVSRDGGRASATLVGGATGELRIEVDGGTTLDPIVLRSYAIGAAHMALGMVWSESISVSETGEPLDLTIRSFGILRAVDLPAISVDIIDSDRPPCAVSDAVFVAVGTAAWAATGFAPRWPAPPLNR